MRCVNKQERTICYRKKEIDVSLSWVCLVIDNEIRQMSLQIHGEFDNVTSKFMINKSTDA